MSSLLQFLGGRPQPLLRPTPCFGLILLTSPANNREQRVVMYFRELGGGALPYLVHTVMCHWSSQGIVFWPPCSEPPCERGRDACQKIGIKSLKETNLGMVYHSKTDSQIRAINSDFHCDKEVTTECFLLPSFSSYAFFISSCTALSNICVGKNIDIPS